MGVQRTVCRAFSKSIASLQPLSLAPIERTNRWMKVRGKDQGQGWIECTYKDVAGGPFLRCLLETYTCDKKTQETQRCNHTCVYIITYKRLSLIMVNKCICVSLPMSWLSYYSAVIQDLAMRRKYAKGICQGTLLILQSSSWSFCNHFKLKFYKRKKMEKRMKRRLGHHSLGLEVLTVFHSGSLLSYRT